MVVADIAGQGVANPIAAILSSGMLLRYSLNKAADADRIDAAAKAVMRGDLTALTADLPLNQARAQLNDGDFAAKSPEHLPELQPNVTASQNHQVFRNLL